MVSYPFTQALGLAVTVIPIDPFYLSWKARQEGTEARFIELAGEVNTSMPDDVIGRLKDALEVQGKELKGGKILVIGLAYKPNVDDDRESPSYVLMEKLEALGTTVDYHDSHIPIIKSTRKYSHFAGRKSVPMERESLTQYDAVLIATAHEGVDHEQLLDWVPLVVDTRKAINTNHSHEGIIRA